MNRVRIGSGALFFVIVLFVAGCVQELDRPVNANPTSARTEQPSPPPTTMPTSTPTLAPTETPLPSPISTSIPTPTLTAILAPTAILTPAPPETAVPTASPTRESLPSETPEPTATSVPEPTATPRPLPTPTITPTPRPSEALFLDVQGPLNGETVQVEAILVYGFTNPGASLSINDIDTAVNANGQFQKIMQLSEGANIIDIIAKDGTGPEQRRTLTVTRLPLQPFILIVTRPENLSVVKQSPIQLIGVTSPQAIVSVNGVTIDVDLGGLFETTISLQPDLNTIDVLATNIDGDVKSITIAIFYAPE